MIVYGSVKVDLSETEVERVVSGYFSKFTQGRWVHNGHLMEEHATSHRYDARIGGPDHPDYELVETIQKLQKLIQSRKK